MIPSFGTKNVRCSSHSIPILSFEKGPSLLYSDTGFVHSCWKLGRGRRKREEEGGRGKRKREEENDYVRIYGQMKSKEINRSQPHTTPQHHNTTSII